ncbi:FAD-dependent oxidoreductase [Marmoricola sp. RAF53]|uniref:FAD-dependent oxidoreductase n=1 Tax=Marmoricola sp. RAF53 TaxID=3233059 RepID=UPI003F958CE6
MGESLALGTFLAPRVDSFWLQDAAQRVSVARQPPLVDAVDCDVCVIGGGYVGMWTALRLKEREPTLRVVLLDADRCGAGASGRNAGMAMSLWPKIETLIGRFGPEVGPAVARESERAIRELGRWATTRGHDVDWDPVGWLMAASSPHQIGAWQGFADRAQGLGAGPYRFLDAAEISARLGSERFLGGMFDPTVATVHPALLAAALRSEVLVAGVQVFEGTRVRSISSGLVATERAPVRPTTAVVLALGGWSSGVPPLARSTVAVASDVVATEQIGDELDASGWRGREAMTTSRMTLRYARRTRDGRMVFGAGGTAVARMGRVRARFDGASTDKSRFAAELGTYFPAARTATVSHAWSGPVDRSADGLPFFGRLGIGGLEVVYGTGFSGNGVAPSMTAGQILASLALGSADQWSAHPFVRPHGGTLPIEPFRTVGGSLVHRAVNRKEDREESGNEAGPVTRRLAGLAPSGLVTYRR